MAAPTTFKFDASSQKSFPLPFPETSTNGEWVAFHGTSSVFESDIDDNGIRLPNLFVEREIRSLVSIFQSMNWYGSSTASFGVLAAFTWSRTMGLAIRPVYLSDYAERCLLYSTRDFAGGETARAIRYSIQELSGYLADDDVRQEHYSRQRIACEDLVSKGAKPPPVIKVNLDWLRAKLAALEPLHFKAASLENQYRCGIVYAIRLSTIDLPRLVNAGPEGLQYFGVIPADRITAKVRVTNITGDLALRCKNAAFERLVLKECTFDLCAKVQNKGSSLFPKGPRFNFFDRNNTDPQAGIDVSEDVAAQIRANLGGSV